jgi:hypothetical protein
MKLIDILTQLKTANENKQDATPILRSEIGKIQELVKKIDKTEKDINIQIHDMAAAAILNTVIIHLNTLQSFFNDQNKSMQEAQKSEIQEGLNHLSIAYNISVSEPLKTEIKENLRILYEQSLYLQGTNPINIKSHSENFINGIENSSNNINIITALFGNLYFIAIIFAIVCTIIYCFLTNRWNDQGAFGLFYSIPFIIVVILGIDYWIWTKISEIMNLGKI